MSETSLKDCIIISLPSFADNRGKLTVVDSTVVSNLLPFTPKRTFWIHGVNPDSERGQHAHRTCWELVCAVSGSFSLTLSDGKDQKTFELDSPSKGVIIPPMVWCKLWNFAEGTVCLTLASDDYDTTGYINDFESFRNEAKHD